MWLFYLFYFIFLIYIFIQSHHLHLKLSRYLCIHFVAHLLLYFVSFVFLTVFGGDFRIFMSPGKEYFTYFSKLSVPEPSFSPLSNLLTVNVSDIVSTMLRHVSFIFFLLRIFIICRCWILAKSFCLYYYMIFKVFPFVDIGHEIIYVFWTILTLT